MQTHKKGRAVIFAAAPGEEYSFFTPSEGDYIICADRGYTYARKLGIVPAFLLGDFDSIEEPLPEGIPREIFPAEKDETDLQLAIRHALSKGFREMYVLGAIGGRVDHFLGNIGLIKWAKDRGGVLSMEDADTYICPVFDEAVFEKRPNRYFSVLPFYGDAVVSVSGTKYTATRAKIAAGDTLGISNEIIENTAKVRVHEGCVLALLCKADKMLEK